MAPEANILLVECSSTQDSDLYAGVDWAARPVARQGRRRRWSGRLHELRRGRRFLRRDGRQRLLTSPPPCPGVTFLASAGDDRPRPLALPRGAAQADYPADSPVRGDRRRDHALDGRRGEWAPGIRKWSEDELAINEGGHGRRRQQLREPAQLPGDCRGPIQHDEARRAGRRPRRRPANRRADLRFLRPPGRQPLRRTWGSGRRHRPPRRHEPGQPASWPASSPSPTRSASPTA